MGVVIVWRVVTNNTTINNTDIYACQTPHNGSGPAPSGAGHRSGDQRDRNLWPRDDRLGYSTDDWPKTGLGIYEQDNTPTTNYKYPRPYIHAHVHVYTCIYNVIQSLIKDTHNL